MKKSPTFLVILAGISGLSACSQPTEPQVVQTQEDDGRTFSTNPMEFAYEGEGGKTALERLQEVAEEFEVAGSGANTYVTSINGLEADMSENEFWALYVDGRAAQMGAGTLETKNGQLIEWKLETF